MTTPSPLAGKKTVVVYRCSDQSQVEDSLPQQMAACRPFAQRHAMNIVDEIKAPAVSASVEEHKDIIYELRDRKISGALDFEVMLFYDFSRFTRTGKRDGNRILAELSDDDIMVVTAKEGLLAGKEGELRTDMALRDSEAYGETLASNLARGTQAAIETGEIPHCTVAPYGCDRLYTTMEGHPLFVLRSLPDGRKAKIDAVDGTTELLQHSPENPAVTKQSNQKIVLIKGPSNEVGIVNQIFRRRYLDGWGACRIVRELNTEKIPGPKGKAWVLCTVERMMKNPLYVGFGYANQVTTGVYVTRDKNQPIELPIRRKPGRRKDGRGRRKNIPPIARPLSERIKVPYPNLEDFLEPEVREIARHAIELDLQRVKPAPRSRHVNTTYFLRGIVRSKQGNHLMTGLPSGHVRYYVVGRQNCSPGESPLYATRMNANVLEHHVLAALVPVLQSSELISSSIRGYIQRRLQEHIMDGQAKGDLLAAREQAVNEIVTIYSYGHHAQEALKEQMHRLDQRVEELTRKIEAADKALPFKQCDTESIIESVVEQCSTASGLLADRQAASFRKLIQLFVSRVSVDLETRAVEMEFALPSWALQRGERILEELRVASPSVDERMRQTHLDSAVVLTSFSCDHLYVKKQPCMTCKRSRVEAA